MKKINKIHLIGFKCFRKMLCATLSDEGEGEGVRVFLTFDRNLRFEFVQFLQNYPIILSKISIIISKHSHLNIKVVD